MHSKGTVSILSSIYELDRIKKVKILRFHEITYPLDPLDLPPRGPPYENLIYSLLIT